MDRVIWLLIGCAIGFVFGYIVRSLQEIKDRVDEVDKHILNEKIIEDKKDGRFTNTQWATNIALLFVIFLTAYSAFSSQRASNGVEDNQKRINNIAACNQKYLKETITALNARTNVVQKQNVANVNLQKAQAKFLGVFFETPLPTTKESDRALKIYFDTLSEFVKRNGETNSVAEINPFPTNNEFQKCINKK